MSTQQQPVEQPKNQFIVAMLDDKYGLEDGVLYMTDKTYKRFSEYFNQPNIVREVHFNSDDK